MTKQNITQSEYEKKLSELCINGLQAFPQNNKSRHILYNSICRAFKPGQGYTEKTINQLIRDWLDDIAHTSVVDHVFLRRSLIDYHYLTRNSDGSVYQLGAEPRCPYLFNDDISGLDEKQMLADARKAIQERKQRYLKKNK